MTHKKELQDFFGGLLQKGATRKEIANLLGISYTVSSHIMSACYADEEKRFPHVYQRMRYVVLEKDKLQHFLLYLELKREFNGKTKPEEEGGETC